MNRLKSTLTILAAATLVGATPMCAQQPHARVSPHETVSADLGGGRVMIVYGRPYTKSPKDGSMRKIWGGVVPFNEVWRTGADEATLLITAAAAHHRRNHDPGGRVLALQHAQGGRKISTHHQQGNRPVGHEPTMRNKTSPAST